MRPAVLIVLACREFVSKITILYGQVVASCLSILELLLLAAGFGSEIEIVVEGVDEGLAMEKVARLF
jgi:phosphotransferase system HPr (HPr) family protein